MQSRLIAQRLHIGVVPAPSAIATATSTPPDQDHARTDALEAVRGLGERRAQPPPDQPSPTAAAAPACDTTPTPSAVTSGSCVPL